MALTALVNAGMSAEPRFNLTTRSSRVAILEA